jgi:hypothetical protein
MENSLIHRAIIRIMERVDLHIDVAFKTLGGKDKGILHIPKVGRVQSFSL